jgi:hypothetical protein
MTWTPLHLQSPSDFVFMRKQPKKSKLGSLESGSLLLTKVNPKKKLIPNTYIIYPKLNLFIHGENENLDAVFLVSQHNLYTLSPILSM